MSLASRLFPVPPLFALLFAGLPLAALPAGAAEEPPMLAPAVAAGTLPPLAERLPDEPRRDLPARADWQEGRYGGRLTLLTRGGRDARDLFLLGYARLLVWDEALELRPDLLRAVEVEDGRRFTLRLRHGHRWSDGAPFTAEDFRFWWQDIANDPELSPAGLPPELLVEGEAPNVSFPDPYSVVYAWSRPNNRFLPALAAAQPLLIYRPAHSLKPYHARHADPAALAAAVEARSLPGWPALFNLQDSLFTMHVPGAPTLQPWRLAAGGGTSRWQAARNPYFHRVDAAGRQLPYIDEVIVQPTGQELIAAKAMAGETDLQARGLTLRDFPLLKDSEARAGIHVGLWPIGRGAQLALYPNLNAADPVWRALLREADFRRALSLAIDREEINRTIYQGLAVAGNNLLLPESPLYAPAERAAWAVHDPARAEALLDGLGLAGRDAAGRRLLADGRPLQLVIESGEVDPAETDVLQLVAEDLRAVGIEALIRVRSRGTFRSRIQNGETVMSLFYGLANGLATPDMAPTELAPVSDRQNQWPAWGRFAETNGREGETPDLPAAERLLALYRAWSQAGDRAARSAAWREMLAIHADQVFTIGLVAGVPQPVVRRAGLRNLPENASYLYEPGAYFGRYRPDTFWFE